MKLNWKKKIIAYFDAFKNTYTIKQPNNYKLYNEEGSVIAYKDGKLVYSCETTGVDYVTSITTPTSGMYNGNNISVPTTYIVSVYAKKSGYDNSEVVTKQIDIRGLKGDVNADGVVSITDAVSVVNIILDNGEAPAAPAMKDQ